MTDSTPQASPLLPVLWLIYIGETLRRAERKCNNIALAPRRASERLAITPAPQSIMILLRSYAGDVNPVAISRGTSIREHREAVKEGALRINRKIGS